MLAEATGALDKYPMRDWKHPDKVVIGYWLGDGLRKAVLWGKEYLYDFTPYYVDGTPVPLAASRSASKPYLRLVHKSVTARCEFHAQLYKDARGEYSQPPPEGHLSYSQGCLCEPPCLQYPGPIK